jgi:hypothetical protein
MDLAKMRIGELEWTIGVPGTTGGAGNRTKCTATELEEYVTE